MLKCKTNYIMVCDICGREDSSAYRCLDCGIEVCCWCAYKKGKTVATGSRCSGKELYLCEKCWESPAPHIEAIREVMKRLVEYDEVTVKIERDRESMRTRIVQEIEKLGDINCCVTSNRMDSVQQKQK